MKTAPNLDALYAELKTQDHELSRLKDLVRSLGPGVGFGIDDDLLSAIDDALDVSVHGWGPALVPVQGRRA